VELILRGGAVHASTQWSTLNLGRFCSFLRIRIVGFFKEGKKRRERERSIAQGIMRHLCTLLGICSLLPFMCRKCSAIRLLLFSDVLRVWGHDVSKLTVTGQVYSFLLAAKNSLLLSLAVSLFSINII
jgi:hypothetical protein